MSDSQMATTTEVIDALDGTTAVARLTDRSPQSVTNWRASNRFPADTFIVLTEALSQRGQTAPRALWGMVKRISTTQGTHA